MDEGVLRKAKDLALGHLGRRMRSERETVEYLRRKGIADGVVFRVIRDLRRVGLLDDRAFAREWTERRLARAPCGRRAVEARLRGKGVSEAAVTEVLDEIFRANAEMELGRRAAAVYVGRQRAGARPVHRGRLYRFLLQRGFAPETVTDLVEEMEAGASP